MTGQREASPGDAGEAPPVPLCLWGALEDDARVNRFYERWVPTGPVALVTAGWEEDEGETGTLPQSVTGRARNAQLYQLADEMFGEDPEVLSLLRARQDQLRDLREAYLWQSQRVGEIAREALRREPFEPENLVTEPGTPATCDVRDSHLGGRQAGSWSGLTSPPQAGWEMIWEYWRNLDRHYLRAVADTIQEYDQRLAPSERPSIQRYRHRVRERVEDCRGLLIAGGHVGVLLNRLSLSGLLDDWRHPVAAWSGGAHVLGETLIFYHQRLPHEAWDLEYSRAGWGWYRQWQVFTRPAERFALSERRELAVVARRVPQPCLLVPPSAELEWDPECGWRGSGVERLTLSGERESWSP